MRGPEIRIKNNSKQRKRRKESKGGGGVENQKTKTKVKTNKKKRDIFTELVKNKTDQPRYILCATHHQLTSWMQLSTTTTTKDWTHQNWTPPINFCTLAQRDKNNYQNKTKKTEEVKVVQSSIMQLDQITNKKTHTKLLKIGKNNNQSVKIRQVHK